MTPHLFRSFLHDYIDGDLVVDYVHIETPISVCCGDIHLPTPRDAVTATFTWAYRDFLQ